MKILFSFALAFVLSLACLPFATQSGNKTDLSNAVIVTTGLNWEPTPGMQGLYMYYTYLGEFPQTHVGGYEAKELDAAYDEEIRDYGNTSNKLKIEEKVDIFDRSITIVTYNDCKYALFVQHNANDANTDVPYNDGTGDYIKTGGYNWFKFEPIKWYALTPTDPSTLPDGTEVPVICDKALFCNVPYFTPFQEVGSSDQRNFNYSYLRIMIEKLLPLTGLEKYKDILIKRVPHAFSWEENDDVISYEVEGGDFMYPASKREINVTYGKYYPYFTPQASDFTFALAVDQESKTNTVVNRQTKQMLSYYTRTAVDTRQPLPGGTSGQFVPDPNPTPMIYSLAQSNQDENFYIFKSYYCMGGKGFGFVPMATLITCKGGDIDSSLEFDKAVKKYNVPEAIDCDNANSKIVHIKTFTGWKFLHIYTQTADIGSATNQYKLVLDNNIDCKGESLAPIGRVYADFDGQGYAVVNLNIEGSLSYVRYDGSMAHNPLGVENPPAGVFQYVESGHTFENVMFLNVNVIGSVAGGVIGKVFASNESSASTYKPFTLKNVLFDGTVTSSYVKYQAKDMASFGTGTRNEASALIGEAEVLNVYSSGLMQASVDINIINCDVRAKLSCEQLDPDGSERCPSVYASSYGGDEFCYYTDGSGPHYTSYHSLVNVQNSCFDITDISGGGVELKYSRDGSTTQNIWLRCATQKVYYGEFDPSVWFCSSALRGGVPLLKTFYTLGSCITSTVGQLLGGLIDAGFTQA